MDKNTKERKLPHGWVVRYSTRRPNKIFYFNTKSGVSSWTYPAKSSSTKNTEDSAIRKISSENTKLSRNKIKNEPQHKKLTKPHDQLKKRLLNELRKVKNEVKLPANSVKSDNVECKEKPETSGSLKRIVSVKVFSENEKSRKNKRKYTLQNCCFESNSTISVALTNDDKTPSSRNIVCKDLITPERCLSSNNSVHFKDFDEKESDDVEMIDLTNFLNSESIQPMQTEEVSSSHDLYIVVDTNIFLSYLKYVKCLIELQITEYGTPLVIIPWVVIQELDSLKNNRNAKNIFHKATEAVHFVFKKLKSGHPRIRGQTATEASFCENNLNAECNDDKILQCCMQLSQKCGKDHVILLTEDKNLSSKAIINGIKAKTSTELAKDLKFSIGQSTNSKMTQNKILPDLSAEKQIEQKTKKEIEDIVNEVQSVTKQILAAVIESEMREIFEDMWSRIVIVKPPWSLLGTLKCIECHWIAVFGFLFPQEMKNAAAELSSVLKKGFCNIEDEKEIDSVFELCSTICVNVHLKFTNPEAQIAINKLKELKNKWLSLSQKKSSSNSPKFHTVAEDHSAVIATFDYVWDCINYTCGLFADVLHYPNHGIVYAKPQILPSETFVVGLLPKVNEKIGVLSEKMRILISSNELANENRKIISDMKNALYSYTEGIGLQFPTSPPKIGFTNNALEEFFIMPENKQLLENGCAQLLQFHSKLKTLMRRS
ncbi:transcriptional protein SWT1 [Centruroides vittatus]|uniref:transcriptional protein SWT1 n=1 Tax=Centruroides vittatus TaxID=120091 RepID=UPI00350FBAE8